MQSSVDLSELMVLDGEFWSMLKLIGNNFVLLDGSHPANDRNLQKKPLCKYLREHIVLFLSYKRSVSERLSKTTGMR